MKRVTYSEFRQKSIEYSKNFSCLNHESIRQNRNWTMNSINYRRHHNLSFCSTHFSKFSRHSKRSFIADQSLCKAFRSTTHWFLRIIALWNICNQFNNLKESLHFLTILQSQRFQQRISLEQRKKSEKHEKRQRTRKSQE